MIKPIVASALLIAPLKAEQLEVYRCIESSPPAEHNTHGKKLPSTWISLGPTIGKIETGDKSIRKIIDTYKKTSWKAEPFYGPVEKFVFKDSKGKLYVVHFEYLKGTKIFGKGTRFAIIALKKVRGIEGEYTGDPYLGSSVTDAVILEQLRAFPAKNNVEQGAAANP